MPELDEKDFIHEEYSKDPYPFWIWFLVVVFVTALAWFGRSWYVTTVEKHTASSPFYQVTNREFSLFFWDNPQYMRAHVSSKTGYFPAFQYPSRVTVEPELADEYVEGPPEIIFLYHVWNRLVAHEFFPKTISVTDFRAFLKEAEEWQPQFWKAAPVGYVELYKDLGQKNGEDNLAVESVEVLPNVVRQAFQGWQNYFKQGKEINQVKPTHEQMQAFLIAHPHYGRSFWRNIVMDKYPNYLLMEEGNTSTQMPEKEVSPLLRVAFFRSESDS
ncbi:MAG: hypothetical protein H0X51_08615 [Parachlamydiaceae bacterium]|nr:hypothetical protein [Parachlamydiaceae bacterium]